MAKGERTFLAYVTPDMTSYYSHINNNKGDDTDNNSKDNKKQDIQQKQPDFKGLVVKFINTNNRRLRHYCVKKPWCESVGRGNDFFIVCDLFVVPSGVSHGRNRFPPARNDDERREPEKDIITRALIKKPTVSPPSMSWEDLFHTITPQ